MKKFIIVSLLYLIVSVHYSIASEDPMAVFGSVKWQRGPSTSAVGSVAEIKMSQGYMSANGNDTRRLLEATQNITHGDELALVGTEDLSYFAVFYFDDIGYVKDEEKNDLDADAILTQIKKGIGEGNKERQRRGWPTMNVVGWKLPPYYNSETNNLEWAVKLTDSTGAETINFNTRYLGRTGVMRVTLVSDPEEFFTVLPKFRNLMSEFTYMQGQKYSQYVQGDKVAQYGLSALIVGGAAAAAAKSGMGKYLGKLIIGIGAAILAFGKSVFGKIQGSFRG